MGCVVRKRKCTEKIMENFQKRVVCPFLFWYNYYMSMNVLPSDGEIAREIEIMSCPT